MPEEMTAVAESPEVSTLVPEVDSVDTSTEGVVEPQQDQDTDQAKTDAQQRDDGRTIPPNWRDLFKKEPKLREMWFQNRALRDQFPEGVKQAVALRTEVSDLTSQFGVESLPEVAQAIEVERGEWKALDEQYASGSPEFVKNIAEVNPEAFSKMMPAALETLATLDGDTYQHLMARVVVNTIQQPLSEVYNELVRNEATKPAAEKLAKWFNGIEALASKQPERKIAPEAEKLQRERAEFENQKAQDYNQRATERMREYNSTLIEKALAKEFVKVGKNLATERKTNPDAYQIMARNCRDALLDIVSKDQVLLKQYSALLRSGDQDKALKFAQAKIDRLAPEAISKIFRVFNRNIQPVKKPVAVAAAAGANGSSGTIPLGRVPQHKEIDWPRMQVKGLDGASGQVYLRGRKELFSF